MDRWIDTGVKNIESGRIQVQKILSQVGLSKKRIYWLMLLDSPGVVLSVRHNLMQGPTDITSTPHSSVLPECWCCSHTVSPLGVRRQLLKLSLKSHCEKGAEGYQCHLQELEARKETHPKFRGSEWGRCGPHRRNWNFFNRRKVNRSKSLTTPTPSHYQKT